MAFWIEQELAKQTKANYIRKPSDSVCQKSDKQNYINTKKEIAKVANVSHDTVSKVKLIEAEASSEVRERLRTGDMSIKQAYDEIKKVEKKAKRQEAVNAKDADKAREIAKLR